MIDSHCSQTFFAERLFTQFDEEGKGKVNAEKIVDTLDKFNHGDARERLQFLFNIYDVNGECISVDILIKIFITLKRY